MQRYIAFEGIEGAGKSTLASIAVELLSDAGMDVVRVREPGGTATGERARQIVLDPDAHVSPWSEALLFAAARAQLVTEVVGPALERGAWVISDRSVYSSLAYQGGGRELGVEAVRDINAPGLQGVWPQRVVLLRVDPEEGLARQHDPDRIGGEGHEFQSKVAKTFDEIAASEPHIFTVIDASRDLASVVAEVRSMLVP